MAAQDVFDGGWMDLEPQFQQFPLDLVIPHAWVLTRDADNQQLEVEFKPRTSAAIWMLERPLMADKLTVSFQQRIRLDE